MKAVIRAAVAAGAIATIAGLTAPVASAATGGQPTTVAADLQAAAVLGNHCQWTKPKVCSMQWTRVVSKNKRKRMFKGYAGYVKKKGDKGKDKDYTVRGKIGVAFSSPKRGKTVIHWKKGHVTLVRGGKTVGSDAWECPNGKYAQTVWHTVGGSNWYSKVDVCGS